MTKKDLEQLNKAWDDLCQQSVSKQDRLDEGHRAAVEFERGLNDLVTWVDQKVKDLLAQPEPADDVNTLQQQIDNNKVCLMFMDRH